MVLARWRSRAQPVFAGSLTARMRSREPGRVAPMRPRTRTVRISDTRVRCTPRGSTRWAWRRRTASWNRPARRMAWRPRPGCLICGAGRETIISLLVNRRVLKIKSRAPLILAAWATPGPRHDTLALARGSIGTRLPASIIVGRMHRVKATEADGSACNPLHVELSEEVDETTVAPPQDVRAKPFRSLVVARTAATARLSEAPALSVLSSQFRRSSVLTAQVPQALPASLAASVQRRWRTARWLRTGSARA
jgi:hypothetical protein